jgi:hypothetical protein
MHRKGGKIMNFGKWARVASLLMVALMLAIPAMAGDYHGRDPKLADSEQPGSVLVFPKFLTGTVDGEPRSEFEIGITCPKGAYCDELEKVKLRAHWVCPGNQNPENKYICKETNFDLRSTVNGTIRLNPNNIAPFNNRVPAPSCDAGYLIVWVIDEKNSDKPIKYDALIGTGILREMEGGVSAYNGIPIQASAQDATFSPRSEFAFDGESGHYQAVTGQVQSTVTYDQLATSPFSVTALTLLTLDVLSNRPNNPVFVDFNFYSENEVLLSTSHEFICWSQVLLSDINPNLTATGLSRKGLLVSNQAEKVGIFGIDDKDGDVTLLGILETVTYNGSVRAYSYSLYHNGRAIGTTFETNP